MIAHLVNHPPVREILSAFPEVEVGQTLIAAASEEEVERARAFGGEYLYSHFYAYRAFTGRISLHFARNFAKGHIPAWHDDEGVRQLLATVLSVEELEHIDQFPIMRFTTIQQMIEHKMLTHIAQILSGEASATFGLQQAQKIAEASAKVVAETRGA
jgi:hypothetical protein